MVRAFPFIDDAEGKYAKAVDHQCVRCQPEPKALLLSFCKWSSPRLPVLSCAWYQLVYGSLGTLDTATCLTVVVMSFMLFSRLESAGRFNYSA